MVTLPITTTLAGILGIWLVVLSSRVIGSRQSKTDDDGADDVLARRIRGQGNFVEYVPIALILFALLEFRDFNSLLLGILAALFAFARLIHGYAFAFTGHWRFGRLYGTAITFGVIAVLGCVAVVVGLIDLVG